MKEDCDQVFLRLRATSRDRERPIIVSIPSNHRHKQDSERCVSGWGTGATKVCTRSLALSDQA